MIAAAEKTAPLSDDLSLSFSCFFFSRRSLARLGFPFPPPQLSWVAVAVVEVVVEVVVVVAVVVAVVVEVVAVVAAAAQPAELPSKLASIKTQLLNWR